jgi:hypothetical protein
MSNGWSREFDEQIILLDGTQLTTLRDAANYVTALPKNDADAQEWQAAIEAGVSRDPSILNARIITGTRGS